MSRLSDRNRIRSRNSDKIIKHMADAPMIVRHICTLWVIILGCDTELMSQPSWLVPRFPNNQQQEDTRKNCEKWYDWVVLPWGPHWASRSLPSKQTPLHWRIWTAISSASDILVRAVQISWSSVSLREEVWISVRVTSMKGWNDERLKWLGKKA